MNKTALLLFIILLPFMSYSQQPGQESGQRTQKQVFEIKGLVLEKTTGYPLEFTTIIIKPLKGPMIYGGMTDAEGNYTIEVPEGTYNVSYEFLSFKTITLKNFEIKGNMSLETVYLVEDSEALEEVELIAEKSTMEIHLDKKVYNVGKDMTVKGGTASDVLDNVPSVTVDADGVVSLRGNENVRILINGKPSGLVGLNDTEALRQFPADAIEKVEVITSPSARYDAEGTAGILNIILRRDKITGFNGVFTGNVGIPQYYGFSTSLNYRLEKVNFFTNIGYSDRESPGNATYETEYFSPSSSFNYTDQDIVYKRTGKDLNANIGLEYYIAKETSITSSFLYRKSDRIQDAETTTDGYNAFDELLNTTFRNEYETSDDHVYQFDLNFTHNFKNDGHKLTFDFQYQDNTDLENTLITNEELFPEEFAKLSDKIIADENEKEILIQSDYVLPMKSDQQLELGFRINKNNQNTDYQFFNEDTNGDFIVNDSLTNVFEYDENISAFYGQYGNKMGKFSALFGLRVENSDISIRSTGKEIDSVNNKNYTNLFPTVNLVYELSETENISLGYNSRIRRPRSRFINPFPSQSSQTNIFQGNPDLDPSISNGLDAGYYKRWEKVTFNTSLYYSHATDVFQFISTDTGETTEDGIPIIRTSPVNLNTDNRYGWEFSANYTPKKDWRINGSFNYFNSTSEGSYEGVDFGTSYNSWFARLSTKIPLPAKIDWQTTMMFRGPRENAQSISKANFTANLAFSRDILKGNGTLVFNVDDLFNSRKRMTETSTDTFNQYSEFQWRERQIRLSFTYRLNQKKDRQRERNGGGGEDDENFGS